VGCGEVKRRKGYGSIAFCEIYRQGERRRTNNFRMALVVEDQIDAAGQKEGYFTRQDQFDRMTCWRE
jgi:hypothetical protein